MSDRVLCPSCGSRTALGELHCFKCGYITRNGKISGLFSTQNASERKQVLQLREEVVLSPNNFSPKALAWLYKAGVYDNVIVKQMIAYCPDIDKVLIPAFCNMKLMFYQLRSLDPSRKDKYLTYGEMSAWVIHYFDHVSDSVFIVEDHLSAIRLRPHFNVVSLQGTNLTEVARKLLLSNFKTLVLWLDPDVPGQRATKKIMQTLHYYIHRTTIQAMFMAKPVINYNVYAVDCTVFNKDPKCYRDFELKKVVQHLRPFTKVSYIW